MAYRTSCGVKRRRVYDDLDSLMQQLEIEVLYNLQCESAASMFNLRDVVTYIAKRVGLIPGRVWFGAGNTFSVKLTAQQRRNFLRFLNRHELKRFLVLAP